MAVVRAKGPDRGRWEEGKWPLAAHFEALAHMVNHKITGSNPTYDQQCEAISAFPENSAFTRHSQHFLIQDISSHWKLYFLQYIIVCY